MLIELDETLNDCLDSLFPSAYNLSHSEVVSVASPDREGCVRWKHPQENNAEVV